MSVPIRSPMEGKVLRIERSAGDTVAENEVVIVLDAMKMEIEVVAPEAGMVREIHVAEGQAVDPDTVLATLE